MATFKITGFAESTVRAYYDMFVVEGAEINDEIDAAIDTLVHAYDPARSVIVIEEASAADAVAALCAMSNSEDESYERERARPEHLRDPEAARMARHAASGLSTLKCRVVECFGAACYT